MFILDLTIRGWVHAEDSRRRTLQRSDIAACIAQCDVLDFLVSGRLARALPAVVLCVCVLCVCVCVRVCACVCVWRSWWCPGAVQSGALLAARCSRHSGARGAAAPHTPQADIIPVEEEGVSDGAAAGGAAGGAAASPAAAAAAAGAEQQQSAPAMYYSQWSAEGQQQHGGS
jgi:hypothetical protein